LRIVTQARETQRKARQGRFRAALVGYTNAGKSSLLRALSGADLFVEDRLFATLDSATRAVDAGSGYEVLVTDTVGFIRKLPHHLVASFRSTLEEAREADLLLHVIDASHPDWEEQRSVVEAVLEELALDDRQTLLVFNKMDRLTHAEEDALRTRVGALEAMPAVFVSAVQPDSLEELRETLRARSRARMAHVRLDVPAGDGEALAALHREAELLSSQTTDAARVLIEARVPAALLGWLSARPDLVVEVMPA